MVCRCSWNISLRQELLVVLRSLWVTKSLGQASKMTTCPSNIFAFTLQHAFAMNNSGNRYVCFFHAITAFISRPLVNSLETAEAAEKGKRRTSILKVSDSLGVLCVLCERQGHKSWGSNRTACPSNIFFTFQHAFAMNNSGNRCVCFFNAITAFISRPLVNSLETAEVAEKSKDFEGFRFPRRSLCTLRETGS